MEPAGRASSVPLRRRPSGNGLFRLLRLNRLGSAKSPQRRGGQNERKKKKINSEKGFNEVRKAPQGKWRCALRQRPGPARPSLCPCTLPRLCSPSRPAAVATVKHLNSALGGRREGKRPPSECSWNWKLSASAVRNMWRNYLSFPVETSSNHPNPAFQFGDNMLLSVLIAPCWIQEVLWIVQQAYCH